MRDAASSHASLEIYQMGDLIVSGDFGNVGGFSVKPMSMTYHNFIFEGDHGIDYGTYACYDDVYALTYAAAFKERAAYNWAVETTIYLHRGARRRGVGRMLYTALEEILRAQGICNVNACIGVPREEKDPYLSRDSVNFHTRMGYRLVGEFDCCGSKFGRWYNMVWMEKHIRNHPAQPDPVKWFPDVRAQFSNYEPEK